MIQNELTMSGIATDIRYLKLGNHQPVQNIKNIVFSGTYYFVASAEGLFVYNASGKYLKEIGKKGRGPQEYFGLWDIAVDHENESLYLLSNKKVYKFDFNGQLNYTFETYDNVGFTSLMYANSRLYFFGGTEFPNLKYNWAVTDLHGSVLYTKENHIENFFVNHSYIINFGFSDSQNIFYWNYLNDTIYQIEDYSYSTKYLFANDKYRLTKNDLMDFNSFRNKSAWQLMSILGNSRFLVLNYILLKDSKQICSLYDRRKDIFYMLNVTGLNDEAGVVNDFDNGLSFFPRTKIKLQSEDWLVQWIDAYKLKSHVASDAFKNSTPNFPEKKKELEKLANSLNESDNPVLMMVKLKK